MLTVPRNMIAVEPMFDPDVSSGGIIIPDGAKERCDQGLIKYLGANTEGFSIGDHVLFSGYAGTTLRLQGEGLLIILSKRFITAIIPDSESTTIEGLYFRGRDGEYFPATYEQTLMLCARSLELVSPVRPSKLPTAWKNQGVKRTQEDFELELEDDE